MHTSYRVRGLECARGWCMRASAVPMAALILLLSLVLLLPLGTHRFAHWAGAPINRGVFPASQIPHAGSAPAESFTASQRTGGAAEDKAEPVAQGSHFNPAASPNPESPIPNPAYGSAAQPRLAEAYGRLPLSFEANQGQTDRRVKFLSRGSGYSLFLTGNEAVLALMKPGARSRKPVAASFSPVHPGSADLAFRSVAFQGLTGPLAE